MSHATRATALDIKSHPAVPSTNADGLEQPQLVLERLPSGEYAWLRPETDHRYILTDAGRTALAEAEGEE